MRALYGKFERSRLGGQQFDFLEQKGERVGLGLVNRRHQFTNGSGVTSNM
jgi:hypothetical protein